MTTKTVLLTKPQHRLVTTPSQFPAFVGGFGSGKTGALIQRCIAYKLKYPTCNVAYYLPTFDLVRQIAFPRFMEALANLGLKGVLNKTYATLDIPGCGQVIFRTMDNPERIVGYEVADSFLDELDTLGEDDARDIWNKVMARNRQKKPDGSRNTIAVGTTPEGFRFVYQMWKRKPPSAEYELIKAPTSSNARNLPEGYIDSLKAIYPAALLAAYLDGEFVNLTSGSVYPEFSRKENHTDVVNNGTEPLHIGMDFNVNNMAAVINVIREGNPHAVDEILGLSDTPEMTAEIRTRYPSQMIIVYPDSSGKSRKSTDASKSDLSILREARFNVIVDTQNPAVKDRILSMNRMIHNQGIRRLKVNTDKCPMFTEALEKQAYNKNGEPEKSSGNDHPNDAQGYFITKKYPIRAMGMKRLQVVGI